MTRNEALTWLTSALAERLKCRPEDIDVDRPLEEHGVDSLEGVAFTGELEQRFGRRFEPTLLWDYPTLAELATYLGRLDQSEDSTADMTDEEVDRMLRTLAAGQEPRR